MVIEKKETAWTLLAKCYSNIVARLWASDCKRTLHICSVRTQTGFCFQLGGLEWEEAGGGRRALGWGQGKGE